MTQSHDWFRKSTGRLGFFLIRTGVTLETGSSSYRGIDRLPYVPSPEEEEAWLASGLGALAATWDAFDQAEYDRSIHSSLATTQEFQQRFSEHGVDLEAIYAEIPFVPEGIDDARLKEVRISLHCWETAVGKRIEDAPATREFLGFDISHPIPSFHSAIWQPNFEEEGIEIADLLNRNGLLDDEDAAIRVLNAANALGYGSIPFCVIAIWTV